MTNYRQTMADTLELMYLMREYKLMERDLSDTEMKRREEIAQEMDDSDFKSRYGDRWKEVKMAVATKAAKKESVDEEDELDEEVELDEWTVSDVEIAMKKKYGKVDKEAIEKLKKVQHMGNVDRNDLVKVGHGKLNVESVELDEAPAKVWHLANKKFNLISDKDGYTLVTQGSGKEKKLKAKTPADATAELVKRGYRESVEFDEATKWKMGDGRPRGGSRIENVRFWDLPKDQLKYIIKDAGEAMKANPTGRKASSGPGNYADQVNDAITVLRWRNKNKIKEEVELEEGLSGDVKKWFAKKGLKGIKVRTVSGKNPFMQVTRGSIDSIPNDIIKKAITLQYGKVPNSVRDSDKIDYGNFNSRMFSLGLDNMAKLVKEEVELDEAKSEFEVKYAKSKGAPIKVTKFMTLDQAKKFLDDVKKDGMNGIISKGGKPVKEDVDLDEARQLKNPKKEVLVVKGGKVVVIDKKDAKEYLNKGWELAEEVGLDEDSFNIGDKVKVVPKAKGSKPFSGKITGKLKNGKHEVQVYNKNVSHMDIMVHELVKEEVNIDESARSDAMRAIRKDKDLGKRSDAENDDDSASDADIKVANKNIIMQMRKAVSMKGNFKVEFGDNKKIKIPEKIAQAVQNKYNSFRKPADKEKFQARVGKSYKGMLAALKESNNETSQSRILGLVGDKIEERKNG